MIDEIQKIRQARRAADESLFAEQNRLRALEARLAQARRRGKAGADEVAAAESEIKALKDGIEKQRSTLQSLKGELAGLVGDFVLPQSPQQLASQLDDGLPCLLFPVRMETRFMGAPGSRELWVRVYPDDIAVHTHERSLTRDEALSGIDYWTARTIAASIEDPDEKERIEKGAWRALANSAGGTRASWIASEVERRMRERPESQDLESLFDPGELKPESWSRAPRTEVLPDRFVLIGITDGIKSEWPFPTSVPSPLILGPNPQDLETELAQQDGDLVVGTDFAWIWDFEAATQVGMAMRVPLPEPFASSGFDRLMVLGLRVSDQSSDHKELLEELIDNHHYAPDGMGLLPQGTPTNHTADLPSGFSTEDAEGDESFSIETGSAVQAVADDLEKSDAQRLAEAWGIRLETLAGLRNAERRDVSDAKTMNRALWPATLGYYLEELLETDPAVNDRVRRFFTADVIARGSLPAIRVGKQPYGILVTSAFSRWQVDDRVDGSEAPFLRQVQDVLAKVEIQWQQLVAQVSHVDAPGDSFTHLLNILGLHATSVDYRRRIGTYKNVLWNLAHLLIGGNFGGTDPIARYFQNVTSRGIDLMNELGFEFPQLPKIFGLLFSDATSGLNGPFVDDVATAEDEILSETAGLPARYAVENSEVRNYIGWLMANSLDSLKRLEFRGPDDERLPTPVALLFRLLHRALLLASHDATMKLYAETRLVDQSVRREQDFTNVEAGRTVTRWEFMEGRVNKIMPQISSADLSIGDFLATPEGLGRPAAELLREVRESIERLEGLTTAALERLTAEHIDLCSYRLDAWEGGLFSRRLERLNALREDPKGGAPKRGVHLGAYGWLENLRLAPPAAILSPKEIPEDLREDGVDVIEQPNNGGYIHGPSINHAVAAAVLRNAYLTHADQENATHFSVNLTSERVRTALSLLEGIRNGQELGALLGYQFERALHDRYVIAGTALAQFILAFRKQYPLVADKLTPDAADASIDRKEAYQVVDGYALVEAVFLAEPPLAYPYGVQGLPVNPADAARQAIIAEVERLRDTLDAVSDLALAEGVFQVTQGNYERAGAMLKAISEGHVPPEPEISRTPRGGAVVHHRIALHFETGAVESPWSVPATPRSLAAPGLNKWLGDRIGAEDSLHFSVRYDLDGTITAVSLADLALQPIDLVLLTGDQAGDLTELEARIDHEYRRARKAADPDFDPSGRTTIEFMSRAGFPAGAARTFFELLPLLRSLRNLVTTSRALGADDYVLPNEQNTDPAGGNDVKRWDLDALQQTLAVAAASLSDALDALQVLLDALPPGVPDPGDVDEDGLRNALIRLSLFGLPGAFPNNASLIEQAVLTHQQGTGRRAQAESLRTFGDLSPEEQARLTVEEKAERFQRAARLILGDAFRIIPAFTFRNQPELEAARAFAVNAPPDQGLLRFTQERLAVDEWLQGVAAVRTKARLVDELQTWQETFDAEPLPFEPLQLPFDEKAHWIALEFPEVAPENLDDPDVFVPRGDFLSIVRHLPEGHDAAGPQAGLVVDEWNEVIPNRIETTGIAVHYNQPSTEPPQCLLLAVSPVITGRWEWGDLVETLTDTLDRAKWRAVEPDFLRTTPYAQLLPAVLSTFTSHPFGTISTNLAAQPASMVFQEGQ
jgi:hypothetical protein